MRKWLRDNDILPKILALFAALLLWIYVITGQNPDIPQTFSGLPVTINGISALASQGLVITEGKSPTVTLKLSGAGDRMRALDRNLIGISIDVSGIAVPGEYRLQYSVQLEDKSILITRITPNVKIIVDRIISKSVPVNLKLTGTPAAGFVAAQHTLSPDAVTIEGPERLLDTIAFAEASYDLTDAKASITTTLSYTLKDAEGDAVDTSQIVLHDPAVSLSVPIHQNGELPLIVDILPTDVIASDMVEYTVSPASVKISGNPDVVSTLNHINLGSISLKKLLEDDVTEVTLPIVLPNGVTAEGSVSTATVTVSYRNLKRASIAVPQASFVHDERFTYAEQELPVTLLGLETEVAQVDAADVTIMPIVGTEPLAPGQHTVPASITVNGNVAVVGKYSVTIIVPENPPGEPTSPIGGD